MKLGPQRISPRDGERVERRTAPSRAQGREWRKKKRLHIDDGGGKKIEKRRPQTKKGARGRKRSLGPKRRRKEGTSTSNKRERERCGRRRQFRPLHVKPLGGGLGIETCDHRGESDD